MTKSSILNTLRSRGGQILWSLLAVLVWFRAYRVYDSYVSIHEKLNIIQKVSKTEYDIQRFHTIFFDIRTDFSAKEDYYNTIIAKLKSDQSDLESITNNTNDNSLLNTNLKLALEISHQIREQISVSHIAQQAVRGRNSELINDILFTEKQIKDALSVSVDFETVTDTIADTISVKSTQNPFEKIIKLRNTATEKLNQADFEPLIILIDKYINEQSPDKQTETKILTYKFYILRFVEHLNASGLNEENHQLRSKHEQTANEYHQTLTEIEQILTQKHNSSKHYDLIAAFLLILPFLPLIIILILRNISKNKQLYRIALAIETLINFDKSEKFDKIENEKIIKALFRVNELNNKHLDNLELLLDKPNTELEIDEKFLPDSYLSKLNRTFFDITQSYKNSLKTNEQRLQFTEKLGEFNAILRNTTGTRKDVSYTLISTLADFLQIELCGIYAVRLSDKQVRLELDAAYAYNLRKETLRVFAVGEGSVGACAEENNLIYIENIKDEHLTITTAFGQMHPKHLYLYPISYSEQVYGVLELACSQKLDVHKTDFLKSLCRDIALTFSFLKSEKITVKASK